MRTATVVYTLLALLLGPLSGRTQSNCPNLDFSSHDFSNWVGYTSVYPYDTPGTNIGTPSAPYPSPPFYYTQGIVNQRQTIITTSTPDPFTCGNVMTLPPDEKSSVRLGNGGIGPWGNGVEWQRDYLNYTFNITPSNSLLTYKYAVVLQDPVPYHEKSLRPRFIVTIRDAKGTPIPGCGIKEDYADSAVLGYKNCSEADALKLGARAESPGDLVYREWTTVGVDLRKFIGQTITISFETWDCGLGGHFGYAYVTAKCKEMKINASVCTPGQSVVLTAPDGFTYKWLPSGQTTQSITIDSAEYGDSATVELTSVGCTSILKTYLFQNQPVANFTNDSSICSGIPAQFAATSGNDVITWHWDFGDGSTDIIQNPVHTFTASGIYPVKLVVTNSDHCSDTLVKMINVCMSSGINTGPSLASLNIYPNPSSGTFTVDANLLANANVQLQVLDLLGRQIYAEDVLLKNGILQKEIDLKNYKDGIYFFRIKNSTTSKVVKLIKKSQ